MHFNDTLRIVPQHKHVQFTIVVDHEENSAFVWVLKVVDALEGIPNIAP